MLDGMKDWLDDLRGRRTYRRYAERERRRQRLAGQLFLIAVFIAAMYYLIWCLQNTRWEHWYMAVPFLATEMVFLLLFMQWANVLWNKRFHRPQGPPLEAIDFSVDVLIPVCREPLPMVEATIRAAVALRYANKTVYVLDDGEDQSLKAFCNGLDVCYLSRPTHEHRKAGNLNYGLAHSQGQLVLALDADQVAQADLIDHIIGYFSLPQIGFVQTKQQFILPDGDPWGNADAVFYEVMQAGKDYDNAAISCGSGVLYRRSALDAIGGFSVWNYVEDLHTSYLLHANGWRSVYHGESYTTGTAPVDVVDHARQRWQWAVDSLRMFFWDNPIFRKGLSVYQKIQYLHFGYHYLAFGCFLPIFFILPIWALFSHKFMLQEPFWRYILARLPYLLLYIVSNQISTYRLHNFKIFQAQAGLFAVYLRAVLSALGSRHRLPPYTVTRKAGQDNVIGHRLRKCWPHLMLVGLSISAMIYGVLTIHNDFWFLLVNLFWASWTIAVLSRFIYLSLFPPRIEP
jgi:cellulose synthase (UDP-forming)